MAPRMRKTKSSRLTLNRNTVRALDHEAAAAAVGGAPWSKLPCDKPPTHTYMKSKCGSCDSIDVNCPILSYIQTGCCTA